jgi:DeoD family purine-nucleoside phosphorylase
VPHVPGGEPVVPIHLKPAAELSERVLLPGDPHRALAVAQAVLERPKMFNHHRGLWGYTGVAPDGELVTVQSTGMGGPSAAIVVEELIAMGARALIRIGTCGALVDGLGLGELITAGRVIPADGASAALGASRMLHADPRLTEALVAATAPEGAGGADSEAATVVSTDLFYDPRADVGRDWAAAGAIAVEMEAATVLQVAARHRAGAACLLAVSDLLHTGERQRISAEALDAAGVRLGEAALAALVKHSSRA